MAGALYERIHFFLINHFLRKDFSVAYSVNMTGWRSAVATISLVWVRFGNYRLYFYLFGF